MAGPLGQAQEETMSASIKVEMFHQTYPIQGDLDEVYIRRIASYVDEKMKAISEMSLTIDTQKVAAMPVVGVWDRLHRRRDERGEREENLQEKEGGEGMLVGGGIRKEEKE